MSDVQMFWWFMCGMHRVLESEQEWSCLDGERQQKVRQINRGCIREKGVTE